MKIIRAFFMLVAGLFLLAGLLFLAGTALTGYHRYLILARWAPVDATVTQCRMTSSEVSYADGRNHRRTSTVYGLELEFRYLAAGREYTTRAISPYATSTYSAMRRQAEAYSTGTHHLIHYDPQNPKQIRYDAGWNVGFLIIPLVLGVIGAVCTLVGCGILAMTRKLRAHPCPACGLSVPTDEPRCPHCGSFASPPIVYRAA